MRRIVNTNIRLNLDRKDDRRAWEHLQKLDRTKFKSYSRAVIAALNDFFDRQERLANDPYLETRVKEDAFLKRVLDTIERGLRSDPPFPQTVPDEQTPDGVSPKAEDVSPKAEDVNASQTPDSAEPDSLDSAEPDSTGTDSAKPDTTEQAAMENTLMDFIESF